MLGPTSAAQARVEETLSYTKLQSFQAALRFLRVDNGYTVVEKDQDSGYLLFEYPRRNAEPTPGSVEVIQRGDSVALVVQLPQLPSYHERHLIQGLLKKLRTDYGMPPERKAPAKAPVHKKGGNDDAATQRPQADPERPPDRDAKSK